MIVNGNLNLRSSTIESLGNLKEVKDNLFLKGCTNLKDLGKLKKAKSVTLGLCPNLKSFPVNLKLEAIYDFDNDFKILSNWKSFDTLQELELSDYFVAERLDFLDIPHFIEPYLSKISFGSARTLTKNINKINFLELTNDYKFYDFLIDCLIIIFDENISLFKNPIAIKRIQNGFEFTWEEKWGGKISMYSKYSKPVKILCSVDIINCSMDYFLDASGLIQNEKDLEEDEEDPENYGHEYSVRNVKFETLKDILRIQSSDDLIKLGKRMGIRYDY